MWQYYCFPALLIRVQISDVWSDKWLFTNWIVQLRIFVFLTSALPITLIRFPVLYLITSIFKTDLSDSASSQDICVSLVKTGDHYCFASSAWLIRFQVLDPNRKRLQNSIVEEILIRQVKSGYYHCFWVDTAVQVSDVRADKFYPPQTNNKLVRPELCQL